ncbi:hypothetical protein ACFXJ8_26210 [Nonomuraea sp. NPDC059194]|uniref:hypothetical protein n=1 Tax=Nonomuraea sp. NPDC059194 TaxID=3346764 RepID=UPI0036CD42EC
MKPNELFDQAADKPGRRGDAIGALFAGLAAAATAAAAERRAQREAQREARRNRPEAVAARKTAARRGWETRRRNAEEKARMHALDDGPVRTGPRCDEMTHDSRGQESFCYLEPGHDGDHDNDLGLTWPRDENETEEVASHG